MGWGLGKNSPIVLSLSKGNYEAMITRHGQNVRWRVAQKCACTTSNNQPDIHCVKCNGYGETYDFQKEYIDTLRLRVSGSIAELPDENVDCEIIKAIDSKGAALNAVKSGSFVEVSSDTRQIDNGEIVDFVIRQKIFTIINEAVLEPLGNGGYRIPGVRSDISSIEGVTYTAAGDIIKIEKIIDASGSEITATEFRRDTVFIPTEENNGTFTAYGIEYIKPFKFFVLSQNLNKADAKIVDRHNGDAVCTFPYRFDVSENDVITVLSGTQTHKMVIRRKSASGDDIIPEFFVDNISYLASSAKEYKEGSDFVVIGQNKIHWICEDAPLEGDNLSVSYGYFPTYRVTANIPMLRTSEDQRIPRKAVLKLLAGFSESRGVNKNA